MRRLISLLLLSATSCSRSNNLLLGRVETKLGSHETVVTDCYRTSVPQPSMSIGQITWEPCRDARILIENEQLTVNGKDYGKLATGDSILVDHGIVSTQRKAAGQSTQR